MRKETKTKNMKKEKKEKNLKEKKSSMKDQLNMKEMLISLLWTLSLNLCLRKILFSKNPT